MCVCGRGKEREREKERKRRFRSLCNGKSLSLSLILGVGFFTPRSNRGRGPLFVNTHMARTCLLLKQERESWLRFNRRALARSLSFLLYWRGTRSYYAHDAHTLEYILPEGIQVDPLCSFNACRFEEGGIFIGLANDALVIVRNNEDRLLSLSMSSPAKGTVGKLIITGD